MDPVEFLDAALILFGHGTTLNAESGVAVLQHAAELRRRGIFAEVREAYWKQEPRLQEVANQVRHRRVFFVPLFISEGYFCEQVIPAALGFGVRDGRVVDRFIRRRESAWFYCRPAGTHESMTTVLLDRARSVVNQFPFPYAPEPAEVTLFLVGHGTGQNENSRQAVENQAERVRGMDLYSAVHAIYLEEDPRVGACYELARTRHIVVVPFFMGAGLHVQEDIPVLLGEPARCVRDRLQRGKPAWRNPTEKAGKMVWYARCVGTDPLMAEVILARVREAPGWSNSG